MRMFKSNFQNVNNFVEKMKNGELTIEEILDDDDIVQDIKNNPNSQLSSFFSNEIIRKLIDYSTKMPAEDTQKQGHKFPFNATEILASDNPTIQERLMNSLEYSKDDNSSEEENSKDSGSEKNEVKKDKVEKESSPEKEKVPESDLVSPSNTPHKKGSEEPEDSKPAEAKPEDGKVEGENEEEKEEGKEEKVKEEEAANKTEEEIELKVQEEETTNKTQVEETTNKKEEEVTNKTEEEAKSKQEEEEEVNTTSNKEAEETDEINAKEEEFQEVKEEEENENYVKSDNFVRKFDNLDYFLELLLNQKALDNFVLVGYFTKILNHLISSKGSVVIKYIFDFPSKDEFDVLSLLIKNMTKKGIGEIINKILTFSEENMENLDQRRVDLVERILQELGGATEDEKYDCICDTLSGTFNNKSFLYLVMQNTKLVDLLFSCLFGSIQNQRKLRAIFGLLIKLNDNLIKSFERTYTPSLTQENPLDFMSLVNYEISYPLEEKNLSKEEIAEMLINTLGAMFKSLKESEFIFFNGMDEEEGEFEATYQQKQKKIGLKKIAMVEYLRSVLDILVNAYVSNILKEDVLTIFNLLSEKRVFWKLHQLFFNYQFSNIFQSIYMQIFDIVNCLYAPKELIQAFFYDMTKEKEDGSKECIIDLLINLSITSSTFIYNSDNQAFSPSLAPAIQLLSNVNNSTNEHVKAIIEQKLDCGVFNEVLGTEIAGIFKQKLLFTEIGDLSSHLNPNQEEEEPLGFGKRTLREVVREDCDIYEAYKKGENYKELLNNKKKREEEEKECLRKEKAKEKNKEIENFEQELVTDEIENLDQKIDTVEEHVISRFANVNKEDFIGRLEEDEKEDGKEWNEEKESNEFMDNNYWSSGNISDSMTDEELDEVMRELD